MSSIPSSIQPNPQPAPGPVHQLPRDHSCCSSCKKWMIGIVSLIVAILAYQYIYMGRSEINTPLNAPKAVANSWENDKQLWGSYRSNVYFGMKPRIPRSLLPGMMWYVIDRTNSIRHTCEEDQVPKFGWIRHNGISFGEQEIIDYGATLKTKFVTTPHGWTARVRADAQVPSSTVLVSFFFYVYNEGSGTIAFTSTEKSKGIIYGQTPELKKFQMRFDERTISKNAVYNHTSAAMPWPVHLMANYVIKIAKHDFFVKRKSWPRILQLPGDMDDPNNLPNVVLYQITASLPFETDIIFEYGGAHSNDADNFSPVFKERMEQFDQKFEKKFHLKSKGYNESEVNFAKGALSNLLGSISYFYGQSKVVSEDSPEGPLDYWPAPLYTAIPSRTSFPRGFLWNEGFHQLLVLHWDNSIVKNNNTSNNPELVLELAFIVHAMTWTILKFALLEVIAHWLDLMNVDGWIPREQILGIEARSKVPAEFIIQVNNLANPPTFFLTLETLIETEKKLDFGFLRRIYPRLKKWFEWFSTTQIGEKKDTYRWRGRNETTELELIPVTMASGLNDFPRASYPTPEEYHVDLRCWMTLASGVMAKIAERLGDLEDSQFYLARYKTLSDQDLLNELHWDSTTKTYSDYGLHASDVELAFRKRCDYSAPTLGFVDSFGYVNLFPFFFKLVSPTSEHLYFILDKLANKNILWTDYGLRSLSKQDPFYDQRNTRDDPPYWRGSIWINMNYLACRALHHYGKVEGPYRQKAEKLYHQLRSNLIKNMYRVYNESGYIWEHYSDTTGLGQGTRPFTGWSSLIVLIMAEKY